MNGNGKFLETLVLGGCTFILSEAILSIFLEPGETPTDGNPIYKLILSVSYLSVAMLLAPYYRETLLVARRNWFLVALLLLALASCLWTGMPDLVLRRSVAVLGTTLFGVALAVRLSLEEQLRLLSWVLRIIAILSLACVLFFPSYGISNAIDQQGEWQGVFAYKNLLGSIMALSVLVEWQLPTETRSSKIVNRLALFLSGVLLFFSSSVTPMLAVAGSVLFVEIYKRAVGRFRIPMYAIVMASVLIVTSGFALLVTDSERVTGLLGRSADLTGRTAIWAMVATVIPERPVLGYGYSGFWYGAAPESLVIDRVMGTSIMYSHNGYLEILLNLGAVGFLFAMLFLGAGMKRAFHCSNRPGSGAELWPLAFFFFFVLHNIGECTILFQHLEWGVCVATVVGSDAALLDSGAQTQEELFFAPGEELT